MTLACPRASRWVLSASSSVVVLVTALALTAGSAAATLPRTTHAAEKVVARGWTRDDVQVELAAPEHWWAEWVEHGVGFSERWYRGTDGARAFVVFRIDPDGTYRVHEKCWSTAWRYTGIPDNGDTDGCWWGFTP